MGILEDVAAFAGFKTKIGKEWAIFNQVITGDENTDVPDGKGGFIKTVRKVLAGLEALAPQTTAARDAAALSEAQALIHKDNALAYANAASAAASGDALHANVFISPKVLTQDLTILPEQNAMILHERIAQGVTLRVQGTVRFIN